MRKMRSYRSYLGLKRIILVIPNALNGKLLGLVLLGNLITGFGCSINSDGPAKLPSELYAPTSSTISDGHVIQPDPTMETPVIVSSASPASPSLSGKIEGALTVATTTIPANQEVHREIIDGIVEVGPGLAYSRLLRFKSGPHVNSPSMEVECDLCVSWENPEPLTYTFHLRDYAKWQDIDPSLGRKVVASDVVYSLNRIRRSGWAGASLLQSIDHVEAEDDHTVTIRLAYRDSDFLIQLANGINRIVPPEVVSSQGDLSRGPTVGSGPWTMDEYRPESIRFERNPNYYEVEIPALASLEILAIPASSTRIAALLTGRVDLTPLDVNAYGQLKGNHANMTIGKFPEQGTGAVFVFKTDRPPFDQIVLRRAVLYGLDPWKAIDKSYYGIGDVAMGSPVLGVDWLLTKDQLKGYLANQEKAKQLLLQVGESGPVTFSLKVADYGDIYLDLANEYKEMLAGVGFTAEVQILNPRSYGEDLWQGGEFQAFLGPVPPVDNPNGYLFGLLHSKGRWNITGTVDQILDELIEKQSIEQANRREVVIDIQKHVMDKALMFMPVTGTRIWAWNDRVSDFNPNVVGGEYFYWSRLKHSGELS